jgi:hypothetical protein
MNDSTSLDLATARRLCTAAVEVGVRPVDALLEQASYERDPNWAMHAATRFAPTLCSVVTEGTLEEVDRIRVHAKAGFHESTSMRERNVALLVYAVTLATALDRFGVLRTSQQSEEVDTLLAGAARCVHPEWAALFDRAIVRHAIVRATRCDFREPA